MKTIKLVLPLLLIAALNESCVTIFTAGGKQKVLVTSNEPDSKVYVNGIEKGTAPAKVSLSRKKSSEVAVKKDGYKSYSELVFMESFNGVAIVDFFVGGVIGYIVDISTGAAYKLNKNYVEAHLVKIPAKVEGSETVSVIESLIRVKEGDKLGNVYVRKQPVSIMYFQNSFNVNSKTLVDRTNDLLSDYGYTLPLGNKSMFSSASSASYQIKSNIKSVEMNVYNNRWRSDNVLHCKLSVDWTVVNPKNEVLYSKSVIAESYKFNDKEGACVLDAYENAMFNLLNDAKFVSLVRPSGFVASSTVSKAAVVDNTTQLGEQDTSGYEEPLYLERLSVKPPQGKKLNHATKSTVTVLVKDGHGSGFFISSDGMLLTANHVIHNENKIEVRLGDGTILPAKLERSFANADLALLKVEGDGYNYIELDTTQELELGIDVYAIGTPADVNLGQSLTKGIISGQREIQKIKLIQTDVKISPGNSGGPLITAEGNTIGLISAKIVGQGMEGLGFAIPSHLIMEKLKLSYK